MFILKGQDFSMKVDKLYFNYIDESEDMGSFEAETIVADNEGADRLIDLNTSCDIEDLNLYINDNDFSFIFEISYNDSSEPIITIESPTLTKEEILKDNFIFSKENLTTINDSENADLPVRIKSINFTEFKKIFDLKGTKNQFINNCPKGFYLTEYKNYVLNKEVRNGKEILCYECILGSVKE